MDDLMIRQAQLATSSQTLQTIQPPKQRTYISLPGVSQEICIKMLEIHEGQNILTSITVHGQLHMMTLSHMMINDTLSDSLLRLWRVLHHRKNFANLFAPLVCVCAFLCMHVSSRFCTYPLHSTSLPYPTPPSHFRSLPHSSSHINLPLSLSPFPPPLLTLILPSPHITPAPIPLQIVGSLYRSYSQVGLVVPIPNLSPWPWQGSNNGGLGNTDSALLAAHYTDTEHSCKHHANINLKVIKNFSSHFLSVRLSIQVLIHHSMDVGESLVLWSRRQNGIRIRERNTSTLELSSTFMDTFRAWQGNCDSIHTVGDWNLN